MISLCAGGSRGTVATGRAGPAREPASTAAARHAEIGLDGVWFGAGDARMDDATRGPPARPEGDRFRGGGQLVGQRGVGEWLTVLLPCVSEGFGSLSRCWSLVPLSCASCGTCIALRWWGAFGTREHGLLRVFGIRGVFARLRAPEIMRTRGAMTCTPFGVLFLALNTHLTLCSALPPRRASCLPNLC